MAKAISSQLANLLATRVACLTILLVMVIPLFDVLSFPQGDYGLAAWVERLEENLLDKDTVSFKTELSEMVDFFSAAHSHGPYMACKGIEHASGKGFDCTEVITTWNPKMEAPPREASTLLVHTDTFMVAFNMHYPVQIDALMGITNILFIVVIMVFSGLALSSVVNELAVRPLERMLGTVKQIATTVFKFSAGYDSEGSSQEEDPTDVEGSSEMKLLEKVVAKLAIITDLQTRDKTQAQNLDEINDEDIGVLNLMQGKNLRDEQKKAEVRRESRVTPGRRIEAKSLLTAQDFLSADFPKNLASWAFNAITLEQKHKTALCGHCIANFRDWTTVYQRGTEEDGVLTCFVAACEKEYKDNIFHNLSHACDVVHSVSRMMNTINSDAFLTELEQLCLLVSAVGHDLGHPGFNNGFLSEVSHELALQYNDRSPLENMHCAKLYAIVTQEESNIFGLLDKESYRDMRKMCIETILHTDMMVHNTIVKDLKMVFEMNREIFGQLGEGQMSLSMESEIFSQPETKILTMDCLLHSADVSNPCKKWEVSQSWAHRVLEEFFAQGDEEKRLGIPVQFLNDRDKLNRPNSQIGFIEFMIAPFYAAQIRLWPDLKELGDNLSANIACWQNLWIDEKEHPEEEKAKVAARCTRVQESLEDAKNRASPKT